MMQAWMVEEGATGKVKKGPRVSTKLPSNLQATCYEEYVAICWICCYMQKNCIMPADMLYKLFDLYGAI